MNLFIIVGISLAVLASLSSSSLLSTTSSPGLSTSSNLKGISNGTDKFIDPSVIGNIIGQLLNTTWKTTTSTTTTTTARPTNTTTTVTPACQCGKGGTPKVVFTDNNTTRIVHGLASNPHAYPWMAALINGFSSTSNLSANFECGGSLINAQFVVTAAHCFNAFSNTSAIIKNISVILGSNSIAQNVTGRIVSRIIGVKIHPKYNSSANDFDIALLKLAVPVTFSNTTRPICLSQTGSPFVNRKVVTAGWGAVNANATNYPTFLREAGMTTISNADCNRRFNSSGGVTGNVLCAVGSSPFNSSNTCFGDSGGPLMLWQPKSKTFTLIGITSYGTGMCSKTNVASAFTRVSKFIKFIQSVTNGTAFCSNSFA